MSSDVSKIASVFLLALCSSEWGGCKTNPVLPPTESPPREFLVPQSIGTRWEYQYHDYYVDADRWQTTTWGNHAWTIVSRDTSGVLTRIQVADARTDSLYKHDFYSLLPDTTRSMLDTLLFSITLASDSIRFCCPEMQSAFQCIGRFSLQASDTISFRQSYPCDVAVVFLNRVGLVSYSYHYYHLQAHHDQTTSMILTKCIMP